MSPRLVVPAAMCFSTFAWAFVFVSLPFHVRELSPLDATATLRWTGWILGITNLVTVVTAPAWGRLGMRYDPKRLYIAVELLQGVTFFGMVVARTLGELFVVRFVLGAWGAASTFAFIMAGQARDAADVRRQVALIQSALTVGQVMGPLFGAIAAGRMGLRLIPGLLLLSSAFLAAFGLAGSVWMLGTLRFLQVLCVAPVFPIVVARIAHRAGGEAIGFINSARIAAAFVGPVAATTLLAWTPAPVLYVCLGAAGAACAPLAWRGGATRAPA